ncbi:HET-domain-containing protein [Annulohypoxylon nitens]|nr:HET-domain-containing protein [Annulohypoxylon nitens]
MTSKARIKLRYKENDSYMDYSTSRNLCERCQVLQFNDSAFEQGARDESGRRCFEICGPTGTHPFLEFSLKDQFPGLPILSDSARNGCAFCEVLRTSLVESCSHLPAQEIHVRFQLVFSPEGRFMSVLARVLEHESKETLLMFGIDGEPDDSCTQWLRLQSAPEDHIFCTKNIEKVSGILNDVDSQESCDTPFYPTRLIHVGTRDSNTCNLVVTDSNLLKAQRAKYAALSYCWGPLEDAKTQFKTERDTFGDRVAGFKPDATSPIMQDAIEVCRGLGIPYIWIDAVCIVQDDRQDWEREAAQMTDVYKNACLTICTPTSASCRDGFLGPRVSARIPFRSRIDAGVAGYYNIRPCGVVKDVRIAESDYETFDNSNTGPGSVSNWWKRGWTFQELALSRRVLLFGIKLRLVFEDKFWSEGDEALTDAMVDEGAFTGMGGTFAVISVAGALESREDETMWMSMVEQYTERQLTFQSDKLPAIGGLAKIAVLGRGDVYLAGIRKERLHRDLFWTPAIGLDAEDKARPKVSFDELMSSLITPEPYIAPSWSWARWRGKIRFDDSPAPYGDHVPVMGDRGELEEAYEKVTAKMSVSKLNPFGQVTEGVLKITSKVAPVLPNLKCQEGFDNNWEMCNESGQYVANLTFDWDELRTVIPFEKLSLVLIGSYWDWQAYKMAKLYDSTDDDAEEDTVSDEDNENMDMEVDMDSSEDDDEQMDDFSSESEDIDFEEAKVRDADVDRFAYGLVLYAVSAEKFFRVGVFSSWPKGTGGLRGCFGNLPSRTIKIN